MSIDTAAGGIPAATALLEITPAALETVLGIRAEEPDPEALALRIEIAGVRGVDYVYDLRRDRRHRPHHWREPLLQLTPLP